MDLYTKSKLYAVRIPIAIGVIFCFAASVAVQLLRKEISIFFILAFAAIMFIHLVIYWQAYLLIKKHPWAWVVGQAIIIQICAFLLPQGSVAVLIGLDSLLIGFATAFYKSSYKTYIGIIGVIIILLDVNELYYSGARTLIISLLILVPIALSLVTWLMLFFKQVEEREHSQRLLQELNMAYQQVRELTLEKERQRIARDLHDTLSQGLTGCIMQLEAISVHLGNNNPKRAEEIVNHLMPHVRKTLKETRIVIDDLRLNDVDNDSFKKLITKEVTAFSNMSGIKANTEIQFNDKLHERTKNDVLLIVRELLSNIRVHSKAANMWLKIYKEDNYLFIVVADDGIGFKVEEIKKLVKHYGIRGVQERVEALGGELKISSTSDEGTWVRLRIPLAGNEDTNV